MRRRIWYTILVMVAAISGLIVLAGYLFPTSTLSNLGGVLLNWFTIVAAIALVAGGLRLLRFQWEQSRKNKGDPLSVWLVIISMIVTLIIVLVFGQASQAAVWIMAYLIMPVETSLVAILAVFLIYILIRSLSRRQTLFTMVFSVTVLLMLGLHVFGLWINIPLIRFLEEWISSTWSIGAIRAILIGVALGGLASGLRVLMGADRPY